MSSEPERGPDCPSDEDIARFVDGTMKGPARAKCRTHIRRCARCRPLVLTSLQSADPVEPAELAATLPHAALDPTLIGTPLPGPRQAGRYRLSAILGTGAMGVVYAAYDPELGRRLAVKLVRARATDEHAEERRQRFIRESRSLARVVHPNVVAVYDVGSLDDDIFIAMELVAGGTLRDWLQRGEHSVDQTLALFEDIGRGLNAVHKAGMVHRDFKPENVLIDQEGRPRVTDFGLARTELADATPAHGTKLPSSRSSSRMQPISLTQTGALLGTPAYMAPEQLRGEPVDARADVFSFAVVLWEALFGTRPFAGANIEELQKNIRSERVQRPQARQSKLAAAQTILQKALRPQPADRTPTMDALLTELHRLRQPTPKTGRIAAALVAVLVLGGMLSGAAVWRAQQSARCQQRPLAATWQQQLRARLVEHLSHATTPAAQTLGAHIVNSLDQYLNQLDATQRHVCEATYVTRLQSEQLFDAQMLCLQRLQQRFELLAESFATSPQLPSQAGELVPKLPAAEFCLESNVQNATPINPVRYREVTRTLATGSTAALLGEFPKARDAFAAAQTLALEVNDRDLAAEAQLGRAQAELHLGQFDRARLFLDEGIANALLVSDPRLAHAGYALLAQLASARDGGVEEAERAAQLFHWLSQRSTRGNEYEPLLVAHLARVYLQSGKREQALKTLRDGLALHNLSVVQRSQLGHSLVEVYAQLGRLDEADVTAQLTMIDMAAAFGADSNAVRRLAMTRVFVVYSRDGAKAAVPLQEEAVRGLERHGDEDPQSLVDALQNLSGYLSAINRDDDSLEAAARAMALANRALAPGNPSRVAAQLSYAGSLCDVHREAEARAILDPMLQEIDPTDLIDGPRKSVNALALRTALVHAYKTHDKGRALHHLLRARKIAEDTPDRADVKAIVKELVEIERTLRR